MAAVSAPRTMGAAVVTHPSSPTLAHESPAEPAVVRGGARHKTSPAGAGAGATPEDPTPPGARTPPGGGLRREDTAKRDESSRLGIDSRGQQNIIGLMNSKEQLRRLAEQPFRRSHRTELNLHEFRDAVRSCLHELHLSNLPSDSQMQKLFDKHRRQDHPHGGVDIESFQALLFRMLSFMLATEEVKVKPSEMAQRGGGGGAREDFVKENRQKLEKVYTLGKKLGKGTFGAVYIAEHKTEMQGAQRRIRVCKVIDKKRADEVGTTYERIREEFEVLKRLDHPHVLRIFESFEDEKNFYILMEQCHGGDLQYAATHPGTTDAGEWEHWCAKIMHHIISGIAYCHQRGVIHKDLKPENVMMANDRHKAANFSDPHAVIVDFGLAEIFSSPKDRMKEVAGTPPFIAPEVWRGDFSKKCDIWSCGVILFFLLSGEFPFVASRIEDFPAAVAKEPRWNHIGGASQEAQAACWYMLTKSERQRPSARELLMEPRYNQWFVTHGLVRAGEQLPPQLTQTMAGGLMRVQTRSNFEKFVYKLVATQLDAGQLTKINDAFKAFDLDGDGQISIGELRRGLEMLGAKPAEAEKVAKEMDVGNTGRITYTEFLASVMDVRGKTDKERDQLLLVAWQQFNPDRRGVVKVADIQHALMERGMTVAELPTEFLHQLHKGQSGEVTFEDFKAIMRKDGAGLIMQSMVRQRGR